MNLADDSREVPNVEKNQATYGSYKLSEAEWTLVNLIHEALNVCSLNILL